MLLYSVKATYTFFRWSPEKNSRGCAERCFFDVERVAGRLIRPTIVSILEIPRCFVGPTFRSLSGRFATLQKKAERQRPRVFLIFIFCQAGKRLVQREDNFFGR